MNKEIKSIVESLEIQKMKMELLDNKKRIFQIGREMSKLTFDREVGLYAFYTDEMDYLIKQISGATSEEREKIFKKLKEIDAKASQLLSNPKVIEYGKLRDEYYNLLFNNDYFVTVNIELREELSNKMELPPIYVEQSHFDYDKHIIDKTPLIPHFIDENKSTFVEATYDLKSFRNYRHFYNKVSFKYLEELCRDYSFDLEGKKLGRVQIRNLKKNY